MTTKMYLLLVVLFFLSIFVAYQVAAWQMTPKHRVGGVASRDVVIEGAMLPIPSHRGSVPASAHYFLAIQRGPDVGPPTDTPGPQHPVDPPGNHDLPCDPSKGKCST